MMLIKLQNLTNGQLNRLETTDLKNYKYKIISTYEFLILIYYFNFCYLLINF